MITAWGFLGAGFVAKTALAPAVHAASNAKLAAVASRDVTRSKLLEPEVIHNSYEELLDDPNIDAVYISLANHQHCEWSIKALNAGKHVLCEKPLALNSGQVKLMAQAAAANNRLLVEAVWSRWHPRFIRIIDLVKSGEIGQLSAIDSSFTFPGKLEGNYRLNPEMGGGSLLDVGPYQIHSWVALAGINLDLKISSLTRNTGASGVDLTTSFEAVIAQSISVRVKTSFEQAAEQKLLVVGSQNKIECVGNDAFTSWNSVSHLKVGGNLEEFEPVDPYKIMIENMSARINGEAGWLPELNQSIHVMDILDQLGVAPS